MAAGWTADVDTGLSGVYFLRWHTTATTEEAIKNRNGCTLASRARPACQWIPENR
jgi:hypothetical protein